MDGDMERKLRQQDNTDNYGATGGDKEKGEVEVDVPKATATQITINLITGGLGAGIFSLPWSTAGASIVPAVAIIAAVLLVNAWTIVVIIHAAERTRTFDLGSLLGHLPGVSGRIATVLCNSTIWCSLFMCLVGYFIVVADAAVPFTSGITLLPEHHRSIVVCMTGLLILPLCFCDQSKLSWSSTLAVLVNIYVFGLFCYLYFTQGSHAPDNVCYFGLSRGAIAMVSAMMQAVIIQMCVLPMYHQLEDRSPKKFTGIVTVAFSCLFFIFAGFAVMAYLVFGPGVHGNILLDLPHTTWGNAARLGAALSVIAVYPIQLMPMIAPVENYPWRTQHSRTLWVSGVKFTVVLMSMNCAFVVTNLGFMNVVNGALSVGVFVALFPSLVGLFLSEQRSSTWWQCAMGALLFFGILMSVLGLMYTDNYEGLMAASCTWGSHK
eukprot:gnl/MRDRNA2_/MRDRNA2_122422_c0_seq1.p1 gnl/MRDRNA2_/MRDRNA2_122422_c0~~gnl/MRDRNA2_/MRDRNA2_122422_c0_seq1.p1  ORF type:complete len:435 (-),score=53.92 gnl/MRDRNA2_/MRDRNA2_122422_c0_seq1:74-1378(-)